MKLHLVLLAVLAGGAGASMAQPVSSNSVSKPRVLLVAASTMAVAGGTSTLTIGALKRGNGVYIGDYSLTVSPYFFKSESGRLIIVVSDEAHAAIDRGLDTAVVGTATTRGKEGESRHIEAVARPADINGGTLKLWFKAGERTMIFEPAYHFSEDLTVSTPARRRQPTLGTNHSLSPEPPPR